MKQNLITDVVQGMLPYLNNAQTEKLQEVLQHTLFGYEVTKVENDTENLEQDLVELFLSAKRIEGCSEKTLRSVIFVGLSGSRLLRAELKELFVLSVRIGR